MTTTTSPPPAVRGPVSGGHPAPRYRRFLGQGREVWLQYAVVIFLAILVLAPVVPTLYQSLLDRPLYEAGGVLSLNNYVRLFTEAGFGKVALNTVLFAGLTTILTIVLAVPMAIVVVRTKMPGGRVLAAAMQWPFFISSLILGFGWIMMYGPSGFVSVKVQQILGHLPWNLYSIPGMALTEAVALAPIAYTFCANALRQSDASLESAAQVCGAGPLRIIVQVILPMLRPPIVYSSILVISMSVETLSVPLSVRAAGEHPGVLNIPLQERLAVHQPGLRRPRRRIGHHPGRHDRIGGASGEATQRRSTVRLGAGESNPTAAPRPWLAEMDHPVRHHILRRDGRIGSHRRPDNALIHAGVQPTAIATEDFDDEQLRPGIHVRGVCPVDQEQPHRRRARRGASQFRCPDGRHGRQALHLPIPPRRRIPGSGTSGHARHHRGHRLLLGLRVCAVRDGAASPRDAMGTDHRLRLARVAKRFRITGTVDHADRSGTRQCCPRRRR